LHSLDFRGDVARYRLRLTGPSAWLVVESSVSSYPPYNIERSGENAYCISAAVDESTDADLLIETKENRMTIRGEKQTNTGEKIGNALYQDNAAVAGLRA